MANGEQIKVKGKSGMMYDFWAYPWGTGLKQDGGVYLVLKKLLMGNYNILYVGQTADLSERFDNHHKTQCFDRNGKTHIGARLEASEQRRLAIEADLIANYQPTCNG